MIPIGGRGQRYPADALPHFSAQQKIIIDIPNVKLGSAVGTALK